MDSLQQSTCTDRVSINVMVTRDDPYPMFLSAYPCGQHAQPTLCNLVLGEFSAKRYIAADYDPVCATKLVANQLRIPLEFATQILIQVPCTATVAMPEVN